MTRQEKGLWTAVIVLTLGMLVMGSVMVLQGSRTGRDGADSPQDSNQEDGSAVATINGEVITNKEWTEALKRRYGSELLLQMLNRKAVYAEAVDRNLTVTPRKLQKNLPRPWKGMTRRRLILTRCSPS